MVSESWDVFTKQLLVEKHISGMICENLGGHAPPFSSVPTPMFHHAVTVLLYGRSNIR